MQQSTPFKHCLYFFRLLLLQYNVSHSSGNLPEFCSKVHFCGRWQNSAGSLEKEYQTHPEFCFFHFSIQFAESCDRLFAIRLLSQSLLFHSFPFPQHSQNNVKVSEYIHKGATICSYRSGRHLFTTLWELLNYML